KTAYLDEIDAYQKRELKVVGLVRTGSEELDAKLGLLPLGLAQEMLDLAAEGRTHRIFVRARTNDAADAVTQLLRARLDPAVFRVRAWHEVSPFMKGMVSYQYGSINVVLIVLYLVIGAGVAAIQLMGVLERTREFAVLSSIGFTPARLVWLVTLETLLIALLAVSLGLLLGTTLVTVVANAGGIDVRIVGGENLEGLMGMDPHLVPVFTLRSLAFAVGLVLPVLLLGGVLPALRAARMTPMEALRRT
ncbi:MAG: ABC transporter permease, partial [Myxococcales bacterium]